MQRKMLRRGRLLALTVSCLRQGERNILLLVTISFMVGIACGRRLPTLVSLPIAGGVLFLLTALSLYLYAQKKGFVLFLCLPLFFFIGHLHIVHQLKAPLAENHIYTLLEQPGQVTVVGTLVSMVEEQIRSDRNIKSRLLIDVRELLIHGADQGWLPTHGRVRLALSGKARYLQPGMSLMIVVRAGRISSYATPGTFDYQGYMAARNIHISGWIPDHKHIIIMDRNKTSLTSRLRFLPEQFRQEIAEFLNQHIPAHISGVYQALLIGSRGAVSPELQEQFKATGTMHLLAISGLHIGLLALMVGFIINRLLRRSRWLLLHSHIPTLTLIGILPILLCYGFIAGMNLPVFRAIIMAAILLAAVFLRAQHSLVHLVAAAALLVLTVNPLAMFTVSFQLSFAAVTALALFAPGLARDQPLGNSGTVWGKLMAGAKTALLISIIATLGTLPFMLLHFNRFSSIGPLMNLLVEPFLCFWALPWGLLAILLIHPAPQLAAIFFKIGGLGIAASEYCLEFGASFPYASIWTITPSSVEIFIYGLLIILWYLNPLPGLTRKVVPAGILLLVLHFTWGLWFPQKPGESRIDYLEVGQGSSTFLHLPDGVRILADGGGSRNSSINVGEQIIGPFLWKKRIWKLDKAIISHPHSDHFNGMGFILKHFHPATLYINGDRRGEGNYSQIIEQARQQGMEIIVPTVGQTIARGRDYSLTCLGMNELLEGQKTSVNDASMVIKYQHGERKFLFPADISRKSEALLIKNKQDIRADILLAAHHGSATSNSKQFLDHVRPELLVVSAGKSGKRYYPDPTQLIRWKKENRAIHITREQGTLSCTTDGKTLNCIPFACY